jgi:hypothetical protein
MTPEMSFSASYAEAAAKFRDMATKAGASTVRIDSPVAGPDGEALATDIAWIGPRNAEKVLVTISGTHGVEGFCGSAAQIDWLRREEWRRLPKNAAALLVHAINPYGFAWSRRVTEENIDLNRNWIDFDQPVPANPGYDRLHAVICPDEWTDEQVKRSAAALAAYQPGEGEETLQEVLTKGQYSHPQGLFFGGRAPARARLRQTKIYEEYLSLARAIAIIDYHTGLGPWGYGEIIVGERTDSDAFRRARAWYGDAIKSVLDGTSVSTAAYGDGLSAAPRLLPHAQVTAIAIEFGVLPAMPTLRALQADAWLYSHGTAHAPQAMAIGQQVRAAFLDESDLWKGMVLGQSLAISRQAAIGLHSGAPLAA